MPGIFYRPVDRRSFLTATTLGSAALALTGCQIGRRRTEAGRLHFALLSDTHTPADRMNEYRGFRPWESLDRIIPEVAQERPAGVIINGDAARLEGLEGDYRELRGLLEPVAAITPIYIGLGNHDDRANFQKAFATPEPPRANLADKHVLVLNHDFMRMIVLDSLMYVNQVAGLLGKKQRTWLSEYLATHADKPIVLFVHHTLGDEDGDLMDARRLFEIVEPHPAVKAIFYGHSHVWDVQRRGRLQMINLPAVGYNFSDKQPVGWLDAKFDEQGVDLTLRAFAGNRAEDRKVRRVNWA
jgi:Icc protein